MEPPHSISARPGARGHRARAVRGDRSVTDEARGRGAGTGYTLAQERAGSRMLLQAADRDWDRRPDLARTQVRAVVDALGANLAETRTIISDLTPPALEHDDLGTALRILCARTTATPSRVVFRTEGEPGALPSDRAAALLRVAPGPAGQRLRARPRPARLDHPRPPRRHNRRRRGTGRRRGLRHREGDGEAGRPGPRSDGRPGALGALGGSLTVRGAPGRGTLARASLPVDALALAGSR